MSGLNGLLVKQGFEMNLVFFQNCVSPHQIPYIKEICNDKRVKDVFLFTPRIDYGQRKQMGWDSCGLLYDTNIKFKLQPLDKEVKNILNQDDVYALFSGIRADKDVFKWFKLSLNYDVKRGIITEAPNIYPNKLLCIHKLRFLLQDYKYAKYINFIFAIGGQAVKYYTQWKINWRIFPFSYCTEICYDGEEPPPVGNGVLNLLFVGRLDKRKNVLVVLRALTALGRKSINFGIIGDGPERSDLERYVKNKKLGNVTFYGSLEMNEVHRMMHGFDVLVLPSRYDGWGAVINEALQCGLYVICSSRCGAKALVVNDRIGKVFCSKKELSNILSNINYIDISQTREYRLKWSDKISGKVLAKYFIDSLLSPTAIQVPWKQ